MFGPTRLRFSTSTERGFPASTNAWHTEQLNVGLRLLARSLLIRMCGEAHARETELVTIP